MMRSMVLHSTQRDAYVHDSHCRTDDARGTQERGSVNRAGFGALASHSACLDADSEKIDA